MQILARHNKLSGNPKQPLSIYRNAEGETFNITTANVEVAICFAGIQTLTISTQSQTKRSCKCGPVTHYKSKPVQHFTQWDFMKWKSNTSLEEVVMRLS
jgi:hypothetical protein